MLACVHCVNDDCPLHLSTNDKACVNFKPWIPCLVCRNMVLLDTDNGLCSKSKTIKIGEGNYTGQCDSYDFNVDFKLGLVSEKMMNERIDNYYNKKYGKRDIIMSKDKWIDWKDKASQKISFETLKKLIIEHLSSKEENKYHSINLFSIYISKIGIPFVMLQDTDKLLKAIKKNKIKGL